MIFLKLKYSKWGLLIFTLLIGFQSFLPKIIETPFLYFKLILLPLIILYFLKSKKFFLWIYIIFIHTLILFVLYPPTNFDVYKLAFLSIFSSIPMYLLGKYLINSEHDLSIFKYVIYGVNLFNLSTIVILVLISLNILDLYDIYSQVGRKDDEFLGLYRFVLGNAIEVPLTMTCLIFSSILLNKNKNENEFFILSTLLNLVVALISQSRLIIIIALLLFLFQIRKSSIYLKIFTVGIVSIMVYYLGFYFDEISSSVIDRFSGYDSGSSNERFKLLNYFFDSFWYDNFLIGNGLTSSSEMLRSNFGEFRTIESMFFEILYDFGFFGFSIILAPIIFNNIIFFKNVKYKLPLIFLYLQSMFFLPIYTSMMFVFFVLGVNCKVKI